MYFFSLLSLHSNNLFLNTVTDFNILCNCIICCNTVKMYVIVLLSYFIKLLRLLIKMLMLCIFGFFWLVVQQFSS